MTTKPKRPPLKSGTAFARYLALGEGRTLERLRNAMLEDGKYAVPALSRFKEWSRQHGWVARGREHDAQVAAAAAARSIETEADSRVQLAGKLRRFSTEGIDKALAMLAEVKKATVGEIETLVKAAVEASRQAEVLDAGMGRPVEEQDEQANAVMADGGSQFFEAIVKLTGARRVH